MGSGSWTSDSMRRSYAARGFKSLDDVRSASTQQVFTSRNLDPYLNPYNVVRECCDSDEHPNTTPLILGLDVTGSMGVYAQRCLVSLNDIISELYKSVTDIQIMTMGIGDLACDRAPLQVSQFESDERISDQLFKIWLEGGGGGNHWESYALAWYFGLYATKLDCWKRNRRGIIITIGDEECPPHLPLEPLRRTMGSTVGSQSDVDVKQLYRDASERFDIYHISIKEGWYYSHNSKKADDSWKAVLGQHYFATPADKLSGVIIDIVKTAVAANTQSPSAGSFFDRLFNGGPKGKGISW